MHYRSIKVCHSCKLMGKIDLSFSNFFFLLHVKPQEGIGGHDVCLKAMFDWKRDVAFHIA